MLYRCAFIVHSSTLSQRALNTVGVAYKWLFNTCLLVYIAFAGAYCERKLERKMLFI